MAPKPGGREPHGSYRDPEKHVSGVCWADMGLWKVASQFLQEGQAGDRGQWLLRDPDLQGPALQNPGCPPASTNKRGSTLFFCPSCLHLMCPLAKTMSPLALWFLQQNKEPMPLGWQQHYKGASASLEHFLKGPQFTTAHAVNGTQ